MVAMTDISSRSPLYFFKFVIVLDDLEAAAIWEEDWLMAFHLDKCNLLSITTK
jgi:hypothetical protein